MRALLARHGVTLMAAIGGGDCSFYRDWYEFDECSDGFVSELDPAAPPAPPPPPAPTPTPTGGGTPGGGATTAPSTAARPGPAVVASRRLTVRRRGRRVRGRLRADRGGRRCTGRVVLLLERRSAGRWRTVRRVRTRLDGRFAFRLRAIRRRHRLRAPVLRLDGLTCRAARSRTLRPSST